MTKKINIAIDGPAASGKSTTAQRVAKELQFLYIDTGAMYRAVTLAVLESGINPDDEVEIVALANQKSIELKPESGRFATYLDQTDVTEMIRRPEIGRIISKISSYSGLRASMVKKQRKLANKGGVVMDGRDIGTVVLPDAEVKVYMLADVVTRARRRYDELSLKGIEVPLDEIAQEISERDRLDSSRQESPLVAADDAHIINTTNLNIDQQVAKVLRIVQDYLETNRG